MASVQDTEFVRIWQQHQGVATSIAETLGINVRAVYARRKRLVELGHHLPRYNDNPRYDRQTPYTLDRGWTYPRQINHQIDDGVVIVPSDAHYWPDLITTAHRAVVAVSKELKPKMFAFNGDIFDGARISRHDPLGWEDLPSVKEELDACVDRLFEIEAACDPRRTKCELVWNMGNHDARFEKALAAQASDFAGIAGFRLSDHFPRWDLRISTLINGNVMIKHRYANGVHAGYNNALKSGLTMVTGHTHALGVWPWGDYNGRRYGVQTGTLAEVSGPQMAYAENSPTPACSGFAVLTFKDGRLMTPELCEVHDGKAYFRGEVVA